MDEVVPISAKRQITYQSFIHLAQKGTISFINIPSRRPTCWTYRLTCFATFYICLHFSSRYKRALERASSDWFHLEVFSLTGKYAIRVDVFRQLTRREGSIGLRVLREYRMKKQNQGRRKSGGAPTQLAWWKASHE